MESLESSQKIYDQQPHEKFWAIGCMSGTSIDGIDAAEICTDGNSIFQFGRTEFRSYSDSERKTILNALGCWKGEKVDAANQVVTNSHIQILKKFKQESIIGFHGQTLAHNPTEGITFQTGSPARLANELGCIVVGDFRLADMRAGGQGAPLAPFYHFALAKYLNLSSPVVFLNLGGVANITWVNPDETQPESSNAMIAFDTGPANGPINDLVSIRLGLNCDKNGKIAARGQVSESILQKFLNDPYFSKTPPKSIDRNYFEWLLQKVTSLEVENAVATLTSCVVHAVRVGFNHLPVTPSETVVCGGGRHNKTMIRMLGETLNCKVVKIDEYGINGDMLEAQAFGYLAVRAIKGLPISSPTTTGCHNPISGGLIYE